MSKPMIRIVELDGTIIDREMNDLEFQQHQKDIENSQNRKAEAEAKVQAKAALLARLGITEAEAQLLLGGN
jgi:hypothetical protein